ncbi:MAG TPA: hypothetical protein VF450_02865 [Noviherbaspirillum sp.]
MDREAALQTLRAQALNELEVAQGAAPDNDDIGMFEASSDDLLSWVDDLEDRVGLDVANFRAACIDYLLVRDGDPEAELILQELAAI